MKNLFNRFNGNVSSDFLAVILFIAISTFVLLILKQNNELKKIKSYEQKKQTTPG